MLGGSIGRFSAVIFDLDGVIADTQRLHARAERQLLAEYGIAMTEAELTRRFSGVSMKDMLSTIFSEHHCTADVREAVARKRRLIDVVDDSEIVPIEGAPELIRALHRSGFPLAVASASGPNFIERVTTVVGVQPYFTAFASSREVAAGKPAPDVFLLAAHRLNVEPPRCIVIEDGMSGMLGARAAGMRCVAFVPPERLTDPELPTPFRCSSMHTIQQLLVPEVR